MASYSVEKIDATGDIGSVERAGFADRLGDQGFAREMHYRVNRVLGEDFFNLCADAEIGFVEYCFGRNGGGVALLKIIQGDDLVATGQENLRANAADVACGSSYKYVQGSDLALIRKMCRAFARVLKVSGWRRVVSGESRKERGNARVAGMRVAMTAWDEKKVGPFETRGKQAPTNVSEEDGLG